MFRMLSLRVISIIMFLSVDNYKVEHADVYNLCLSTAHNDDIVY